VTAWPDFNKITANMGLRERTGSIVEGHDNQQRLSRQRTADALPPRIRKAKKRPRAASVTGVAVYNPTPTAALLWKPVAWSGSPLWHTDGRAQAQGEAELLRSVM
jgi:hypothetical protein